MTSPLQRRDAERDAILAALVSLGAGCVPVTAPVSDIDKAEPDKAIVGSWDTDAGATNTKLKIEVPALMGHPKGLMRAVEGDPKMAIWFFTSKFGKHTYANLILGAKELTFEQFTNEDDFAQRQKRATKPFFVLKYTIDGNKVTFDGASDSVVAKLMKDEKIARVKGNDYFYETPAGWLAKYLDKNDPMVLFDGSNDKDYYPLKK